MKINLKNKGLLIIAVIVVLAIAAILIRRAIKNKKLNDNVEKSEDNIMKGLPPNPSGTNRGLRNNNPGNLRLTVQKWTGKVPNAENTDGAFEQFKSKLYGIRAMIITLRTYITKHNITTLRGIVSRYAPPNENNTNSYINNVSQATGISPDAPLKFSKENMRKIVTAMAKIESGTGAVTDTDFNSAWEIV